MLPGHSVHLILAGSPMDWSGEVLWIPFLLNVTITFSIAWGLVFILRILRIK